MKKIVIDARLSGLKHAGIGRYVQSLVERLEVQSSKLKVKSLDIKQVTTDVRHYSIAEQIKIPLILKKENPDLVHFPHFNVPLLYNGPFVVTIHDLLWHEQVGMTATTLPAWIYWLKYLAYRLVLKHAVLKSKAIIVPSSWVKKKIVDRFPAVEKKIHVIYEGVAQSFISDGRSAVGNEVLVKYNLQPRQYLIYTGSLYPHKNVELILNVVQHLIDLKFVVCCSRSIFWDKFQQEVRNRGLEEKIVFAGFVPDDELAVLYKNALAFVFPSKSEGFGLPGLEAMAAGCPVISSTAGALPEIYGDSAAYFDPKSDRELREEIERVRKDKEFREELIKKGMVRAKKFTWEKCARETMEVYESCLSLRQNK